MRSLSYRVPAALFLVLIIAGLFVATRRSDADSVPASRHSNGIQFARPPLRFEVNEGQADPQVRFTARDSEGISFLTQEGAVFQISRAVINSQGTFECSFVQLKTIGANPNARAVGMEQLPGVTNYFIGNDKRNWRTNVAGYARVKYEEVYPGIDLVYYGNEAGALEYDFIVAPGVDPNQIGLSIEGAEQVKLDPSGDLVIEAATGVVRQHAPLIYQEIEGKRQEVTGRYRMTRAESGKQALAFALDDYDTTKPLVIDPQVIYATYLGGTSTSTIGNEGARGVAVDMQGSVYILGDTISADFPTKTPAQGAKLGFINAFITKLDPGGQMIYSTFLGGSSFDSGAAIKVDETGAVYIGGSTSSSDFPTVNPIQGRGNRNDAFITKVSPSGSQIIYSTYLGKEDNETVTDLALDTQKNTIVLGNIAPALGVSANDFPIVNPIQARYGGGTRDGFLAAISSNGSTLLFSSYLGGNGNDYFQKANFDPSTSDLYVSFYSDSADFSGSALGSHLKTPTDVIANAALAPSKGVMKMTAEPGLIAFRYAISALFTSLNTNDELNTEGFNFLRILLGFAADDTTPDGAFDGGGLDAKLKILDRSLNVLRTTSFGGSGEDTLNAVAMDASGVYVVGNTKSANLPTLNPIQASPGGGSFEGYLAVFRAETLERVFSTYLGGPGNETITGVTVDTQGNIYVVGETFGNFPNPTSGAFQNQLRGRTDAFIIKISPAIAGAPSNPGVSSFNISNRSGVSLTTDGSSGSVTAGYARIQPGSGSTTPSGMAIFGFRAGGVLVSEAAVPASGLLQSGRIYAEVNGPVNTGLAIANPNNQAATITFNFTDTAGQAFGSGTTTVAANSQVAAFLDQTPFNGGNSVSGTFSFSSNVPVAVVALRGFTNERSEFLITTLPVSDLAAPVPIGETILFPHFAEGGGWKTQVVLVNPTDSALTGNVQFFTPAGAAATLTIDGQSGSSFPYSIAARSSRRFQSSGLGATQAGSIRIIPSATNRTPSGLVIFTYKGGATTVSEAGVPALRTGNAFRLYAEASGNFDASQIGSIETGIAIANASSSPATVTYELTRLDGSATGLTGTTTVPGNGQTALFMNQIAGFSSMGNPATPFQGVLRISSSSAAIAIVGLRGRYNERRDFLITTTAPVDESSSPPTTELFFPHLADSGGYTTQFVLFSGSAGQASTGTLRLFSQGGQPFNLSLR